MRRVIERSGDFICPPPPPPPSRAEEGNGNVGAEEEEEGKREKEAAAPGADEGACAEGQIPHHFVGERPTYRAISGALQASFGPLSP